MKISFSSENSSDTTLTHAETENLEKIVASRPRSLFLRKYFNLLRKIFLKSPQNLGSTKWDAESIRR